MRQREGATFVAGHGYVGSRYFFVRPLWRGWDEAAAWIGDHAAADTITAPRIATFSISALVDSPCHPLLNPIPRAHVSCYRECPFPM